MSLAEKLESASHRLKSEHGLIDRHKNNPVGFVNHYSEDELRLFVTFPQTVRSSIMMSGTLMMRQKIGIIQLGTLMITTIQSQHRIQLTGPRMMTITTMNRNTSPQTQTHGGKIS